MPTLLLSLRYTDDSRALRRAAEVAGWEVFRLADWRPPQRSLTYPIALYGEPLLVDVMASALDLTVFDSPPDWLTRIPSRFTQRNITAMTLGAGACRGGILTKYVVAVAAVHDTMRLTLPQLKRERCSENIHGNHVNPPH